MFNGELISEPTLRFYTVPLGKADGVLGVAVMDRPKALNALDHGMIRELLRIIEAVEIDPVVKGLWIESSAEKAFCAGGDVRDVTDNGQAGGLTDLTGSADYLADEYLLDVWLRRSTKPIFAWGDGYIMGGGMGIFQGADVRFVTEHSNLAMPEVRIGFVPDCGGSWFLNRVPNGLGICLAMSGTTVGAEDGCWLNLADWLLPRTEKTEVFDAVLELDYSSKEAALSDIGTVLHNATSESSRKGPWEENGARLGNSVRHQPPMTVWHTMLLWNQRSPNFLMGSSKRVLGLPWLQAINSSEPNIRTSPKLCFKNTISPCACCLTVNGVRGCEHFWLIRTRTLNGASRSLKRSHQIGFMQCSLPLKEQTSIR